MIDREQSRSATHRTAWFALAALLAFPFAAQLASAQTYTVLYTFQGQSDGGFPTGGLYRDAPGNLYGITLSGADRQGVAFLQKRKTFQDPGCGRGIGDRRYPGWSPAPQWLCD